MSYPREHDVSCCLRRYAELPDHRREWWPGFGGRYHLCTCGMHPDADASKPEYQAERAELEQYLGPVWAENDQNIWVAEIEGAALFVSRLGAIGEWTYRVRFPDSREISARHPYLTRRTAQAAAERAAAEQ